MNRPALIVSAALSALLPAEFVRLELRARREHREADGREGSGPSAHHDRRENGGGSGR